MYDKPRAGCQNKCFLFLAKILGQYLLHIHTRQHSTCLLNSNRSVKFKTTFICTMFVQ